MSPPVCSRISRAVVSRWILGLAGLVNWEARIELGVAAWISSARLTAPATPPSVVSTSCAPKARMIARRSLDIVSGMVMMTL